ncbi:hypothetical protein M2168_000030 [Streptomyces sp. CZ24]|uniref:hypothetical protein n=1 Tax=unclassified Streptomyces TaxID=2593676 RepID=UPI001D04803E|nr:MULTISPECIES: hypothetical protein [unclassified Streptomyces]MCQ9708590.1 hypothetical protein [Streptomyces sp. BSP1]MDH6186998.1 hypothetical protein [Streptomyces sp. CZ24]UDF08765.1 hypothetical protein LH646_15055 [Streptomyces sp. WA1-19]
MTASVPPGAGPVPAELFASFCDDAAVFPPGELPLAQAVPAHLRHVTAAHAPLVGPLVVPQARLPELAELTAGHERQSLDLAVTVPSPEAAVQALASVAALPTARLRVLEVAVPEGVPTAEIVPRLTTALRNADDRTGVTVYVEVPRDERRPGLIASLADSPFLAKFRTGGVRAGLYPDERELARAVLLAVRAQVPFKATAGLHHAVRNTDPRTGFEQHGHLNLLAATGAALGGAGEGEVVAVLAERDATTVAGLVGALSPEVRSAFRSFGTCSLAEPVGELAALGLLDPDLTKDLL